MGTLKVDNLQKEDGTAIITDGVIPTTILKNSGVGMVKLFVGSGTAAATFEIDETYINSTYDSYMFIGNFIKFNNI